MSASPRIREYPIELDKVRHIRFDLNAMSEFQDLTGINILEKFDTSILRNPKNLKALVYSCLIHEDESLTEKIVGNEIGISNMPQLLEALVYAINDAYPTKDDVPEGESETPLVETPKDLN